MKAKEVVYLYDNSWQCPIWVLQVSAFRVCINLDIVFISNPFEFWSSETKKECFNKQEIPVLKLRNFEPS